MSSSRVTAPPLPQLPAAEVLSFLKETRGVLTWTTADLAKSLRVSKREALQIATVFELQGYVKPAGETAGKKGEWLTTEDGNSVSGSSAPRFTRPAVMKALSLLRKRIRAWNDNPKARYRVSEAVAYGDFLSGRPRMQAADVGVRLERRQGRLQAGKDTMVSASEHAAQKAILTQLRQKDAMLHLQAYAEWMTARSHETLLSND
jgi:hypothetical protein